MADTKPGWDPFGSAVKESDDKKKEMLDAVVAAGTAGKQIYADARARDAESQKAALSMAQTQAQIGGVTGGPVGLGAGMTALAPLHQNQMNVNETNFSTGLTDMQARNESYMGKLGATLPILRDQNILKATNEENRLKAMGAERARQEAAAREAEALEYQRRVDLYNLQRKAEVEDRDFNAKFQAGEKEKERGHDNAKTSAAAKAAAAPKGLTELSDSELKNYLTGTASRTKELASAQLAGPLARDISAAQGAANKGFSIDGSPMTARQISPTAFSSKDSLEKVVNTPLGALARQLGVDVAGLDPNRVYGLITDELSQPDEAANIAAQAKTSGGAAVVQGILGKPEVRNFMAATGAINGTDAQLREAIRVQFPGDTNKNTRLVLEYVLL